MLNKSSKNQKSRILDGQFNGIHVSFNFVAQYFNSSLYNYSKHTQIFNDWFGTHTFYRTFYRTFTRTKYD